MTTFWPKVYASEAALAAHEQPLEGTHEITELQGTPEACLAIVVPYRFIKRRIVWFDLVDNFGMSLLESVQCIAVDPMIDIRRFREAALVEVKAALHEHARSFNVAVFASRNSLESNQGPLPLDFPLLDTQGDGRGRDGHLILVADNVALKPPTTIQDVNYNLVAENGMPLLDSPQLVSLPSDSSFLVVRTAVFKHIRHHLKVEAVEANLTLYVNNEAFLRNDSLPLHKRLSLACTAVLVVVQPIALKPSEVYVDIFEDTGVMMLASPLRVLLSGGSTICDVRDAAFEHIRERLVKSTIEADLVVFEDQDAYTAKQPTPVEHNSS
ncbi:hypothetical protein Poli38472_005803 [Pythium oligandrum]|uniref:Uncharacterized protein n=1 Tax=Pythium oligandrum TaxID=41045 RepID=A0A8K1CRR1_PYTOL|nr:hypothetical protein Poli38472_005803 [Pythium oligandrum]|eukprot:TMW68335.1 hypothetical protein Poli38472_005803 [Pythium oligandrum]